MGIRDRLVLGTRADHGPFPKPPTQVAEPPPPPIPPVSLDPLVLNTRRWSATAAGVGDGEGGSTAAAWAQGSATARHTVIARVLKAAPPR